MLRPEEQLIFEALRKAHPNFAGRPVTCALGADPPDFLCVDSEGKRIGVELGEWLNEQQMAASIKRQRFEQSYLDGVNSKDIPPPKNVGMVWLGPKPVLLLSTNDTPTFREELLKLINQTDSEWHSHPEWQSAQGAHLRGFPDYPILNRYLDDVKCFPRSMFNTWLGYDWIGFPSHGDAYTPRDAVNALLNLLTKKTAKYSGLHQIQDLEELYLLAHYNKAIFHNTPYIAPGFGLNEVAEIARKEVVANPGPFQKIFLFNATEPGLELIRLFSA